MSDNKRVETLLSRPLPWDELREHRVLTDVLDTLENEKTGKRPGRKARLVLGIAASLTIVVSAALFASSLFKWNDSPGRAHEHYSRVALRDAGYAFLAPSAELMIDDGNHQEVKISQTIGKVRYEIERQRTREVVVRADHVEVRVLGTVFTVDLEDRLITVDVERGSVRVNSDARSLELKSGETFTTGRRSKKQVHAHSNAPSSPELPPARIDDESNKDSASTRPLAPENDSRSALKPSASVPEVPRKRLPDDLEEDLKLADDARRKGDLRLAADILHNAVKKHTSSPILPAALFTLGNIELSTGNPRAAARAYEECRRSAPRGPLAEDALANAADSWEKAGDNFRAKKTARLYLDRYTEGMHASRMRNLAE